MWRRRQTRASQGSPGRPDRGRLREAIRNGNASWLLARDHILRESRHFHVLAVHDLTVLHGADFIFADRHAHGGRDLRGHLPAIVDYRRIAPRALELDEAELLFQHDREFAAAGLDVYRPVLHPESV